MAGAVEIPNLQIKKLRKRMQTVFTAKAEYEPRPYCSIAGAFNQPTLLSAICSVTQTLLWLHGLQPARLLCPWGFPGRNTGMGCHFLLQRIFMTQGLNQGLLHWQADSLPLSYLGSLFCYPLGGKYE